MTRYAFFGDIQGHAGPYATALVSLGVDVDSGVVPEGLTIVQVGDLIHKGPDSAGTVALADRLLRNSPTGYVQLAGNHEGHYLGGPQFWPDPVDDATAITMAEWFVERRLQIAAAVEVQGRQLLIGHGGLTARNWQRLGFETDAFAIAEELNQEFYEDPAFALRPGRMLRGAPGPPGVAWAEPHDELYLPWLQAAAAPFGQVHGHASLVDWRTGDFHRGVSRKLRKAIEVDTAARHTAIVLAGQPFYGIDTAYGASPATPVPVPLVL